MLALGSCDDGGRWPVLVRSWPRSEFDHRVHDQPGAAALGGRPLVGRLVVGRVGLVPWVLQQLLDQEADLLPDCGREAGVVLARDFQPDQPVARHPYICVQFPASSRSHSPVKLPARARASCSCSDNGFARIAAIPHQRSSTASAGARSNSAPGAGERLDKLGLELRALVRRCLGEGRSDRRAGTLDLPRRRSHLSSIALTTDPRRTARPSGMAHRSWHAQVRGRR